MEEDKMSKKVFTQELEGTRKRGKPRKRWKEEVERDLQVPGVRSWRQLVADRKAWKDIVRQAKAHSGLYCQWKKKTFLGYNQNKFQLRHGSSKGGGVSLVSVGVQNLEIAIQFVGLYVHRIITT